MTQKISNPASAIGEAVGHIIENQLKVLIESISRKHGDRLVSSGDNSKKLLMKDHWDNQYDIDMVIEDSCRNPLVLLESKYLRYKKHMRDKGSWICVAHSNLRDTYPTIRSCVAVLIGDWTKGAKNLLASHDITILEIPFTHVSEVLAKYGVEFRWKEKEREKAVEAWEAFSKIAGSEKTKIGQELISIVEKPLAAILDTVLSDKKAPKLASIELKFILDGGQRLVFRFNEMESTMNFLSKFDLAKLAEYSKRRDTMDAYFREKITS